jgi:magnesium and cobalt exporter, CNNM family
VIVDLLLLAAAVALVAANAVFVAAEFSLVTVDRAPVRELAAQGDRGARGIAAALRRLSFQLSGAQLGITITSLLLGVIAEPAIADLVRPGVGRLPGLREEAVSRAVAVALALVLATVAQMVFGELVPKNAALARPLSVARFATPPQRLFSATFGPLIRGLNGAANRMVRALGVEPQEELASARSPEELGLLVRLSAEAGTLPSGTAAMLHRALRFPDKSAGAAMTPRPDCVTVPASASVADLLELARRVGHLRYPVAAQGVDDIVGVVQVAAAFGVRPELRATTAVSEVAVPAVTVPESIELPAVLERLRSQRAELAVVIDEYGGFAGVLTVEDLAEELVGEMADEYDRPQAESAEPAPTRLRPGETALLPGGLRADEVAERTGFAMPAGPYDTLAGLVLARLGRLPEPGERVDVAGWTLAVVAVRGRRIESVAVTAP